MKTLGGAGGRGGNADTAAVAEPAIARGRGACAAVAGSGGASKEPPQLEQNRPLAGLAVPQRGHARSAGRCPNSKLGAGGRMPWPSFERGSPPPAFGIANVPGEAKNGAGAG